MTKLRQKGSDFAKSDRKYTIGDFKDERNSKLLWESDQKSEIDVVCLKRQWEKNENRSEKGDDVRRYEVLKRENSTLSLEQIALDVSQTRTRRSRDGREIRKEIYVHLHSLLK